MNTIADDFAGRAWAAIVQRWPELETFGDEEMRRILAGAWLAHDAATHKRNHRAGSIPPTQQEVADYLKEIGYDIEPGAFIDHYQQKGWRVGHHVMKDWKSAVRNWKRSGWGQPCRPQQARQQTGTASLGALQMQLESIRGEIRGITNPGGSAWPRTPAQMSNAELVRLAGLEAQRESFKEMISNFANRAPFA